MSASAPSPSPQPRPGPQNPEPEWLSLVRVQVESLRYGVVQLVVHEGKVTQIDKTEKVRLPSHPSSTNP